MSKFNVRKRECEYAIYVLRTKKEKCTQRRMRVRNLRFAYIGRKYNVRKREDKKRD